MEDEKIDDHVDTSSCKHPVDHQEEEEEETEEMKMEKFYSLIRNYHDARNRLRSRKLPFACNEDEEDDDDNNNISIKDKKRRKATMGDVDREEPSAAGGGGGWVPCFELEDFGTEVKLLFPPPPPPPPPSPPPPNTSNLETQDDGLGSLDLKLAL
ncbi:unnamed protein product [Prunus brigantina]